PDGGGAGREAFARAARGGDALRPLERRGGLGALAHGVARDGGGRGGGSPAGAARGAALGGAGRIPRRVDVRVLRGGARATGGRGGRGSGALRRGATGARGSRGLALGRAARGAGVVDGGGGTGGGPRGRAARAGWRRPGEGCRARARAPGWGRSVSLPVDLMGVLQRAASARAGLWKEGVLTAIRLVHGGADCLPGITVDRFEQVAVVSLYRELSEREEGELTRAVAA